MTARQHATERIRLSLPLAFTLLMVVWSVSACSSTRTTEAPGSVQGDVFILNPVAGWARAYGVVTVAMKMNGRVVATQQTSDDKDFDFRAPPGTYTFDALNVRGCVAKAMIRSHQVTKTVVRCEPCPLCG
jgi:hypothetical protein